MKLSRYKASLWITEAYVYILKYKETFWRTLSLCQGCVYRIPDALPLAVIISDVCITYGIRGYDVTCFVSGSPVLWRKLSSTAADAAQARQNVIWEEELPDTYSFDVGRGKRQQDKSYEWFFAACEETYIVSLYKTLTAQENTVSRIDVLPAAVSEISGNQSGNICIFDGACGHYMEILDGIPKTYVYNKDILEKPDINLTRGESRILWQSAQDKNFNWQDFDVPQPMQRFLQKWELSPVFSLLCPM